jgi:hypothetical protein
MQTVGWAAVCVGFLTGVVLVLGHILDAIPPLCQKMIKAVRSLRALHTEIAQQRQPLTRALLPAQKDPQGSMSLNHVDDSSR